ncbi:hypothetical protein [Dyella sp. 333MFSha]|uniref:hypothetical protein n=1 Tax=Dyella sp. 333MFSha TaxID=1798240 RepID=UPI000B85ED4F|nr:hypothetical protein [Dyella sp. 333MFSha]
MTRFVWVFVLLCLLPVVVQAANPLNEPEGLCSVLQREVPDDDLGAYERLWALEAASGQAYAPALRTWIWRRSLTAIDGSPRPPTTVKEAIESPMADQAAYRNAAQAYLTKTFSIRFGVDDATGRPSGTTREAPGIFTRRSSKEVFVKATVQNKGPIEARIRMRVAHGDVDLRCNLSQVKAGMTIPVWCATALGHGSVDRQLAGIDALLNSPDGVVPEAEIDIGSPTRHVTLANDPTLATDWEATLREGDPAFSVYHPPTPPSQITTESGAPRAAWAMLVVIAILLATGGTAHYRSANGPVVSRGWFVGYMMLAAAAVALGGLDQSAGAPMSGVLSVLVEIVVGLPWSISLLTTANHLPNGSGFPWLFVAGNAALLFVLSAPGRRYKAC